LLVTARFALTLFAAPRGNAGKRPTRVESSSSACGYVQESCAEDSTWIVLTGTGITQPLGPASGNITSYEFDYGRASGAYGGAHMDIVQWNPAGLMPDPTTVALRTVDYNLSYMPSGTSGITCSPPIANRCVPGLADPPSTKLAFNFHLETYPDTAIRVGFARNSYAPIPSLLQYANGGARSPVPTAHPVLEHTVCGGDDAIQGLCLVQSVMTTNAPLDTSTDIVIQRFRVRVPVELHWVELAVEYAAYGVGSVEVYDGEGTGAIPPPLLHPLAASTFLPAIAYGRPSWASHYDFATYPTLQADHDYWLCFHTAHAWTTFTRLLTGRESPYFQQSIGPFYRTTTSDPNWQEMPDRTLSFRVVGLPLASVQVSLPQRSSAGPRLTVAPNPARGAALVRWSGAAGTLWLDVFDARGRRVAHAEGANGGAGEWRFRGLDENGRALPAGVYFVRGTDDAGRVASQRVVLIR
jgi:hypothetical protein